jgi:hypothetical protein
MMVWRVGLTGGSGLADVLKGTVGDGGDEDDEDEMDTPVCRCCPGGGGGAL